MDDTRTACLNSVFVIYLLDFPSQKPTIKQALIYAAIIQKLIRNHTVCETPRTGAYCCLAYFLLPSITTYMIPQLQLVLFRCRSEVLISKLEQSSRRDVLLVVLDAFLS